MRLLLALAFVPALLAGCTDWIPVKDDFGTSALRPRGDIPPEFAAFNNYDPAINALLAKQMCAQRYFLLEQKKLAAVPGEIDAWRSRCDPYEIRLDNLAEHFSPFTP